jgi:DNA modification methylase
VKYEIKQGDCLDVLKTLPSESVNCCITSPPYYGLRDYGTAIYEGGNIDCEHSISGWSDNLKPDCDRPERDGTKRQFCLKCGAKRIDDQIGLEESPEIYVEKMVAVFREVKRILRDDGTVWLNLGDSYCGSGGAGNQFGQLDSGLKKYKQAGTPKEIGLKPKDLIGIPWRVAFALQADGWYLRQDIIWHKPNPMPESVTDRCTKAHEYIFLMSKNPNYYLDNKAIQEPCTTQEGRPSAIVRDRVYGYNSKQAALGRARGGEETPEPATRNKRSVWSVTVKPYKEAHFATFPKELIEPCVLAGCPKDGTILDPFGGSGTTAEVAIENGRNALLIELNPEYIELAKTRISNTQTNLFC